MLVRDPFATGKEKENSSLTKVRTSFLFSALAVAIVAMSGLRIISLRSASSLIAARRAIPYHNSNYVLSCFEIRDCRFDCIHCFLTTYTLLVPRRDIRVISREYKYLDYEDCLACTPSHAQDEITFKGMRSRIVRSDETIRERALRDASSESRAAHGDLGGEECFGFVSFLITVSEPATLPPLAHLKWSGDVKDLGDMTTNMMMVDIGSTD
jgi:hypothetical protein